MNKAMLLNNLNIFISEKFLEMPLPEKRKFYRCKKHVTIDGIQAWPDYAEKIKEEYGLSVTCTV